MKLFSIRSCIPQFLIFGGKKCHCDRFSYSPGSLAKLLGHCKVKWFTHPWFTRSQSLLSMHHEKRQQKAFKDFNNWNKIHTFEQAQLLISVSHRELSSFILTIQFMDLQDLKYALNEPYDCGVTQQCVAWKISSSIRLELLFLETRILFHQQDH